MFKTIFVLCVPFILYGLWVSIHSKNNKTTFKEELYHQASNSSLDFFIALLIIAIAYILGRFEYDHFDFSFLISIIITYLLAIVVISLRRYILNKVEDAAKLTADYEGLRKKYVEDSWYTFNNKEIATKPEKIKDEEIFPDIVDLKLIGKNIKIVDSDNMYQVPDEIKQFENKLYTAHDTSNTYNQLNIRVDDWQENKNTVTLYTSRTTYYKSLVTNRALDYKVLEQKTVRELLMYGPFLPSLKESLLSNHLGFNGIVISEDGYFPLIKRQKRVSVSKNVYGPSVAASMKSKYALNDKRVFTPEGIRNAIIKEIYDELKIKEEYIDFSLKKNLVYAYRDVYEGSKPQLFFYAKSSKTKNEIEEDFKRELIKKKGKENIEDIDLEDGYKMLWVNIKDINKISVGLDSFDIDGITYKSTSASTITLAMFINVFNEGLIEL